MYHLIIDTCVWINLSRHFVEVRKKMSDLVEQEKVILILPQLVIDEWNKNKKSKVIAPENDALRSKIKHAREISQYLKESDAKIFKRILDEFKTQKSEIESLILQEVEETEKLFTHPATIKPPVTATVKSQAIEFALAKKAPFKSKNSMADALILFSSVEYIKQNKLANCIFISSNTQDFFASDKKSIHENLQEVFEESKLEHFYNIGQAINEIETNLISEESIRKIDGVIQIDATRRKFVEHNETWEAQRKAMENSLKQFQSLGNLITQSSIGNSYEDIKRLSDSVQTMVKSLDLQINLEHQQQMFRETSNIIKSLSGTFSILNSAVNTARLAENSLAFDDSEEENNTNNISDDV